MGCFFSYSGLGWNSLEPSCAQALLAHTAEGEFWMDETEFQQEFDEVTVSYPIIEEGYLQSIFTGSVYVCWIIFITRPCHITRYPFM